MLSHKVAGDKLVDLLHVPNDDVEKDSRSVAVSPSYWGGRGVQRRLYKSASYEKYGDLYHYP
jgi:hypothetical protein